MEPPVPVTGELVVEPASMACWWPLAEISTRRGLAFSDTGTVTVSTPSV